MASPPRILRDWTGTVQTPKLCKKPLSLFIIAPRSGVKALRNTSAAKRQPAKLC
jgi:hypothetical protein